MSFRRKLTALGHPNPDKFDITNSEQSKQMVVWLEDQKIRHYSIDDRAGLRNIASSEWQSCYDKYLRDLACPIMSGSQAEVLDWLLGCAVRFEYGERVEQYNAVTRDSTSSSEERPQVQVVSSNPLDNLDFSSQEFRAGVDNLAASLKIPRHPDHLVTLLAICTLVSSRLSPRHLADPASVIPQGEAVDLADLVTSSCGDKDVDEVAAILRLLHIRDLRTLQTQINECIVAIQTITANPKTDTRLGKVGR